MISVKKLRSPKFKLRNTSQEKPNAHPFEDIVIYLISTYLYSKFAKQIKPQDSRISSPANKYDDCPNSITHLTDKCTTEYDDDIMERLDFLSCLLKNHIVD